MWDLYVPYFTTGTIIILAGVFAETTSVLIVAMILLMSYVASVYLSEAWS